MKDVMLSLIKDIKWEILIPSTIAIIGGWYFAIKKFILIEEYKYQKQFKQEQQEKHTKIINFLKIFYNDLDVNWNRHQLEFKNLYDSLWLYCNDDIIKSLNKFLERHYNNSSIKNVNTDLVVGELLLSMRKDIFPKTELKSHNYIILNKFKTNL